MNAPSSKARLLRPDFPWAFLRFPLPVLAAGLLTLWLLFPAFDQDHSRPVFIFDRGQIVFMLALAFLAATAAGFATLGIGAVGALDGAGSGLPARPRGRLRSGI